MYISIICLTLVFVIISDGCLAKIKYWLIDQKPSFFSRVDTLVLESFNKIQNPLHKNVYLWLNVLITYLFYSEGVNNLR